MCEIEAGMTISFSSNLLQKYNNTTNSRVNSSISVNKKTSALDNSPKTDRSSINNNTAMLASSLAGLAVLGTAAAFGYRPYKNMRIENNIKKLINNFKDLYPRYEVVNPIVTKLKNGKTKIEIFNDEDLQLGYRYVLLAGKNGKLEKRITFFDSDELRMHSYLSFKDINGDISDKFVTKMSTDSDGETFNLTFIYPKGKKDDDAPATFLFSRVNDDGYNRVIVNKGINESHDNIGMIDAAFPDDNKKISVLTRFVKDRNSNLTCIKLAPNHKPVAFAMDDIDRYYDKETSDKLSKFISEDVSKFVEKIGEISDKLSLGVNL